jgi:hypothetical protein
VADAVRSLHTASPAAHTDSTITDLNPGDRVRCYDAFNGTVAQVVDNFLGGFALVDYDHDQGRIAVYAPYVQAL